MVDRLAPKTFLRSSEGTNATYNFQDIQDGSGIAVLYGAKNQSTYVLTKATVYSDEISTAASMGTDPEIDVDFDVTINMPLRVKGWTSVNVPYYAFVVGAGQTATAAFNAKLRKYSGTTETEIASGTSTTITYTADTTSWDKEKIALVSFNTPNTLFKKGDVLRLTIQVSGAASGGSSQQVAIAHDPKNRDPVEGGVNWSAGDVSQLSLYLPTVIDR